MQRIKGCVFGKREEGMGVRWMDESTKTRKVEHREMFTSEQDKQSLWKIREMCSSAVGGTKQLF